MKELEYARPHPVVERVFAANGYQCVVLFQSLGHRCGYVGVPERHPCYGKSYDEVDIDCHGGLTYADGWLFGSAGDDLWWFGFDCAHAGDAEDLEALARYYPDSLDFAGILRALRGDGVVRSAEFVGQQCKHIAAQLKQVGSPPRLKPCPFCGAAAGTRTTSYVAEEGEVRSVCRVFCLNDGCGVSTPLRESETEVVKGWNRRTDNA